MRDNEYIEDLEAKIQYLVDHWPEPMEDNGISFPDGDFWPKSGTPEYAAIYGLDANG